MARSQVFYNEKTLVRHKGKAILVYQRPVPGMHGAFAPAVLQLAAERAYQRGWRKIVLQWEDMPCSVCFEHGYAYLLGLNMSMAMQPYGRYNSAQFLCKIDNTGEVYLEPVETGEDSDLRWHYFGD